MATEFLRPSAQTVTGDFLSDYVYPITGSVKVVFEDQLDTGNTALADGDQWTLECADAELTSVQLGEAGRWASVHNTGAAAAFTGITHTNKTLVFFVSQSYVYRARKSAVASGGNKSVNTNVRATWAYVTQEINIVGG